MKKIICAFTVCMFAFAGMTMAQQTALSGKWSIIMDNDNDAGAFKGKDVGVIEFKKDAATGKYYFETTEVRNGFSTQCAACAGADKNKSVVGSKWGEGFAYNAATSKFEGGTITDPSSGKKGTAMSIRVVNATTMEMSGKSASGKIRTVTLKKQ